MASEQGLDRKKEIHRKKHKNEKLNLSSFESLVIELKTLGIQTTGLSMIRQLNCYVDQHLEFRAAAPIISRESPAASASSTDPDLHPAKVMSYESNAEVGLHFDGKDP